VRFENGQYRVTDLIAQAARAMAADAFVFGQTQALRDEAVWRHEPKPDHSGDAADSVAVAAFEVDPVVAAVTDRFDFL
jgi:hypothetical protein